MSIPVLMPQLGESVAEGTVIEWLKKEGDRGQKDEPILVISTEKVDAEIPAPAAGVLSQILVKAGEGAAVRARRCPGACRATASRCVAYSVGSTPLFSTASSQAYSLS